VKFRLSGGTFLAAMIVACVGWLVFYSGGTVAREASKLMEEQVKRGSFSGVVLISHNGKVLFEHAYGMADAEKKIPNTLDTRFRIGSISKTITAIAVMQLEGEHKLALTDSICMYIDDCPPGWADIKLHHLLAHTSGIFNYTARKSGETETVEEMYARPPAPGEELGRFLHEPLAFAPGAKFEYSNSNYRLLAHVIEKVTGKPFGEALRQRIFEPAGMHDSGLAGDWPSMPHAAVGYWLTRQGKFERAPVVDGGWSSGNGGIYSTVLDLQKFSDALDQEKLIPRATLERMRVPVTEVYGYGWQVPPVSRLTINRKMVGHGGALPGFLAQFLRFEDEKVTVIALTNRQSGTLAQVAEALGSAAFGEPFTPAFDRETVEVPEHVLKRYEGEYESGNTVVRVLVHEGHLYARIEGQGIASPDIPLLAESETVFFIKGSSGYITVAEDGEGKVTGFAVSPGDGSSVFLKKLR
jgi:CubicO group peptidase (beta-lactamase class C family)